ncbi:MAG: helix-turn-helix transcriptional regulator [Leptolinea sp.]
MTHLIVILTDQTFFYRLIPKASAEVLSDIQIGGSRLSQYGIDLPAGFAEANHFTVHNWRDWVIALPVEKADFEPIRLSAERRLTQRQLDVLCWLSEGMTGKQIANRLNIHARSVSLHIAALKLKLQANTSAECVQKAARLGILKPGGR